MQRVVGVVLPPELGTQEEYREYAAKEEEEEMGGREPQQQYLYPVIMFLKYLNKK